MSAVSRGFLVLRDEDVRLEPWSVAIGDRAPSTMPSALADWTYYQPLAIRVTLLADLESLLGRLDLETDARLGAVVIWNSPGTSLRGASEILPLETYETSIALDLEGSLLRGTLDLECQVILIEASHATRSVLAPTAHGSILWTSSYTIDLEGIGARMPIIAVRFSTYLVGAGVNGLWWLRVDPRDFYSSAESALWVWLNEESAVIQELLETPNSEGSLNTQTLLKLDVYRQIIEIGILDDDFILDEPFPPGSLGAVVAAPIRLLGRDMQSLRQLHRRDAQRLNAEIQVMLGGL